ncbi:MAG: hypothetical protein LBL96_11255 [Clostridiales bacterium]|jgi:hypothetical protein|nr:hypothetical protein [Clostridiales bacterium]
MHGRSAVKNEQPVRYSADDKRGRYRQQMSPAQDERLTQIIRDFEIKTEVIYKTTPSEHIHNAPNSLPGYKKIHRSPLGRDSNFGRDVFLFNLILTLILPPIGIARSVLFLRREDKALKELGMITMAVGFAALVAWFIVVFVFRL